MGDFCPSSPSDLPKCQTIIIVCICVKPSRAKGLTLPNVKNHAGQTIQSVFLRRRRRRRATPSQEHSMPTFGVSAALSIEHCRPAGNVQQKGRLKVQRWVFRVFRGFRGFRGFSVFRVFSVFMLLRILVWGFRGWL